MALYNEILVGRFNRSLQKYFGMKGGPPAAQLAGDVQVNHSFAAGEEMRYLEGWDTFAVIAVQTAVVGQNGAIRLRNPPTSNVIAVLESATVFHPTAADQPILAHGNAAADLATAIPFTTNNLDRRGRPASALSLSSTTNAGALTGLKQLAFIVNTFVEFVAPLEFVLLPGDAFQISSNQANQDLRAGYIWRERYLEEGERF